MELLSISSYDRDDILRTKNILSSYMAEYIASFLWVHIAIG